MGLRDGRRPGTRLTWNTPALVAALLAAACRRGADGPPFPPERALETFRLEEGYVIELVAAEPLVASPVALAFDADGRMFVVEMPGYPLDTRATGRVKLLHDEDGDGRPEKATVFADGLVLPTGLMPYKKGLLVTAAPDVLYFPDDDGDGRADERQVVLTGFAFSNPQHTVNSPVFGLDNWIHLAHEGPAGAVIYTDRFGDRGGKIRFPGRPEASAVEVGRHAVRFRPDTFEIEARSGSSQFGHAFDAWGRYFTLDNSNHLRHEAIAARYLKRNPRLPVGQAMQDVSDHGSNAKVYAITRRPRFELLTEPGEFTSACSLALDLAGAFSTAGGRSSFVAEPVQNLVHRDLWSDAGSTFVARRDQEGREFLASTDAWFRPVNLTFGPDGALYVVDYYREMIEHPEWTSTAVHRQEQAMYRGQDRGRIWRITPKTGSFAGLLGARARNAGPRLRSADDAALVAALAHDNAWWRMTAQRLLVEGRRAGAEPLLRRLFAESPKPLARLHALWTLEGLGRLDDGLVLLALADAEAGVRENALVLAEPRLDRSPTLIAKVLTLGVDDNPKVRFQLLATLGSVPGVAVQAARAALLGRDLEDPWVQVAALSAASEHAAAYARQAFRPGSDLLEAESPGRVGFVGRIAALAAAGTEADGDEIVSRVAESRDPSADWWRAAAAVGLARGAQARGTVALTAAGRARLLDLAFDRSAAVRQAALQLLDRGPKPKASAAARVLERAEALAEGRSGSASREEAPPADRRADAIRLLGLLDPVPRQPLFERLLDPKEPDEVQAAAVQALGRIPGGDVGRVLLARWPTYRATVRSEAADALLADPERTRLLVAALRQGQVQAWGLSFWQKRDLLMHDDPAIRDLARPLLEPPPEERDKVLRRYQAALDVGGDPQRGRGVFDRVCAKCHRFEGRGAEVGPDLGTVRNRAPSLLLEEILRPSRAIAQNYESYLVETTSGETLTGLIASQTPTAIALRREGAEDRLVPRADIRRLSASNLSAMPEDLDQQVDVAQMADLLALLTVRGGSRRVSE